MDNLSEMLEAPREFLQDGTQVRSISLQYHHHSKKKPFSTTWIKFISSF